MLPLKSFGFTFAVLLAGHVSLHAQVYDFTTLAGAVGETGITNGPGAVARFYQPVGLAIDAAKNLYVADSANSTIRKISPDGTVSTLIGTPRTPGITDGSASSALLVVPWGVRFNAAGDLFVADTTAFTVRKMSPSGVVSTYAGRPGTSGTVDGTGLVATFNRPTELAADSAGNIFVADYANHTIRKITAAGIVSTFAGGAGVPGATDGLGTNARFAYPVGLVVDAADNIFVTDSGTHTIRKITPAGNVSTFAGLSSNSGANDGAASVARFSAPNGIAIDVAGNLYITEYTNNTVRKITPAGVVSTLGGLAVTAGSADGVGPAARFNRPYGIVIDRDGTLYVADTFNNTIRKGVIASAPVIVTAPLSIAAVPGGTLALAVAANGSSLTYQWKRNNLPIPGATTATYVFSAQALTAGNYTVDVINGAGTATSAAATVAVAASSDPGRITNLAIRSQAGTDAQTLIVGTVVGGAGTVGTKPLLLRGVGPTLGTFNVPGALADPVLNLFTNAGKIAENDDWAGTFDFSSVGAFNFTGTAPKDAALYSATTASASYSIQISGKNGTTGTALAEVYDATPSGSFTTATPRLINVSARTQVGTGGDILIAGFTIGGSTAKTVLIRAAGPALADFGVTGSLVNPKLELFKGSTSLYINDDWAGDSALSSAAGSVGAFPFTNVASKDAALLITLAPGGYTAQVSGVGNTTGVALIEVYEVP